MEERLYEVKLRYIDERIPIMATGGLEAEKLAIAQAREECQIPEDEEVEVLETIWLC